MKKSLYPLASFGFSGYSCAMKSHFRKFGNQMSGSENHLCEFTRAVFYSIHGFQPGLFSSIGAAVEQLENEKIVVALQAAIDTLQMQLEVKDRQIEELTETLKATQQTAAAAQALHAGTMKQRILCDDKVEQQIPEPAQKKSWISKILGNNK